MFINLKWRKEKHVLWSMSNKYQHNIIVAQYAAVKNKWFRSTHIKRSLSYAIKYEKGTMQHTSNEKR